MKNTIYLTQYIRLRIFAGLLVAGLTHGQTINDLSFGPKHEVQGNKLDQIVAVVGNDIITQREVNRYGKGNSKAALQQLIMEKLLLQEAKRRNISISDTAVNVAGNNAVSRNTAKKQLIISRLQQSVANQYVSISNREVNDLVEKQLRAINEAVDLEDILIKVPQSASPEILNRAQAKTQEVLNLLKTQAPQQVAAQYPDVNYQPLGWVELSKIPALFSKVLYNTPTNQFTRPVVDNDGIHILRVKARKGEENTTQAHIETLTSHILIKNNSNAEQEINKLYRQLNQGADFAKIASHYSQDFTSAARGGSLSWVQQGQMVPAFETVMNQTPVGQISKPFKTQFGYHILKVLDRKEVVTNNRKALETKARKAIFQRKAAQEWDLWLQRLREEAYVEIR